MGAGRHAIAEDKPPLANAIRQVEEEAAARDVGRARGAASRHAPGDAPTALTRALHTLGPGGAGPLRRRGRDEPARAPAAGGDRRAVRHGLLPASPRGRRRGRAARPPWSSIAELAFDLDLPSDILTVLDADRRGRTLRSAWNWTLGSRIATRT